MRAVAILLAFSLLGTSAHAIAGDGKRGESRQAVKAGPEVQKPAYPGVRMQQGRVQTDDDLNGSGARRLPGRTKVGDVTLKRGVISRDAAIRQRRALAPLKERTSTAGMRTAEAEYAESLRKWAMAQDKRLLELQKIHTAYDRLKTYRDHAARMGEDTSRIDPRLEGMEKKMAALSDEARRAWQSLDEMTQQLQAKGITLSGVARTKHDTARNAINNDR